MLRGPCGSTVALAVVDSASAHRAGQKPRILAIPRLQLPETSSPCLAHGRGCREERKRPRSAGGACHVLTQSHSAKYMRQPERGEDGAKPRLDFAVRSPQSFDCAETIVLPTFDVATNRHTETAFETVKFDAIPCEAQRLGLQQRFRGTPLGEAHARARQPKPKLESEVMLCATVDIVCPGTVPVGSGKDYDHLNRGCIADEAILPILLWSWCQ